MLLPRFGPARLLNSELTGWLSLRNARRLAHGATAAMLRQGDTLTGYIRIVAVPDDREETAAWEKRWRPVVHGRPRKARAIRECADAVVARAMHSLSLLVTSATRLEDSHHRDLARRIFRILRFKEHEASA